MASYPEGSGPPSHAYSATSKSWFGSVVPKKFGFAGWKIGFTLIPTACHCCAKIAAEVARRWLPALVVNRIDTGVPPHVQYLSLLRVGTDGPPVHPCALNSEIAFFCENSYSAKYGFAFVP